ncbi:MAG: hypothetical protein C0595_06215 [Marinilabiliales bacterium]|nr:MAG: hypothetical protein C0595_06215 [Marinilabiliales bacterium]
MKRSIIILSLIAFVFSGFSQTVDDALRYSQQFYEGSARNMAMGSAFGGLGADFSVASTNPAGMGLYRSSELSITPEVTSLFNSSTYNNMYAEDSKSIFNLGNLGYVQTTKMSNNGWKFFQFGVGMNRLNTYNTNQYMQGNNLNNSRLDIYKEQADGIDYSYIENDYPYDLSPAWSIYLLDTIPGYNDYYYTPVPFAGTLQEQTIQSSGSTNEWLMSLSANYSDKLFIGATVGLPYIRFKRETFYRESDAADTIPYFNSWSVRENLVTTGWGINLKVGIIYQPTNWIRIGGAIHTPSYYWSMRDSWYTTHTADLEWTSPEKVESVTGNYEYRLTTPMRLIGDAAFIINKMGLVSFEYEYVDYSTSRFKARDYGFNDVNASIRSSYQSTHNIRVGTEWRLGQTTLRAGYNYYSSPYADNLNDGERQTISAGIGYNFGNASIDFAYLRWLSDEDYYMYSSETIQPNAVVNSYRGQQFALTLRTKF